MINWQELTIDMFVEQLRKAYHRTYGDIEGDYGNIACWVGRLSLENISNSDALYHDIDHTIMVSLAGLAIIEGKHLREGGVSPRDWTRYMIAVLCHDIGYVKGVLRDDTDRKFSTGVDGKLVEISPDGTDVALTPYHVDRGKQFVRERFGAGLLDEMDKQLDAEMIAEYIEMTRFPSPKDPKYQDTKGLGGLVRAADFVGQLGDPDYFRKTPALFYEFEELGVNSKLGYKSPHDMRKNYAKFYWEQVNPYLQDALVYLRLTEDGKQWVANMHSHVFDSEHVYK
jgi:hypothetical protein